MHLFCVMKIYLIFGLILFASACGSDNGKVTTADPAPVQENPSPIPTPKPDPLVGKWADASTNTLEFKADNTVLVNANTLDWQAKDNYLTFSTKGLQIDLCSYEIKPEGRLNQPIIIVLDLICAQSSNLRYTKQP